MGNTLHATSSGDRDRRLVFFAESATKSPRGAMVQGKGGEIARAWGKVTYGTGAERRQAGRESSTAAATARVPSNSNTRQVDATCFCELDGATWDVTGNVPLGRRERDITLLRRK